MLLWYCQFLYIACVFSCYSLIDGWGMGDLVSKILVRVDYFYNGYCLFITADIGQWRMSRYLVSTIFVHAVMPWCVLIEVLCIICIFLVKDVGIFGEYMKSLHKLKWCGDW